MLPVVSFSLLSRTNIRFELSFLFVLLLPLVVLSQDNHQKQIHNAHIRQRQSTNQNDTTTVRNSLGKRTYDYYNNITSSNNLQSRQLQTQQQLQQAKAEPILIVHVGPHKTGTSTIQSVLTKLDYTFNKLHRDNLYYLGKVDGVERTNKIMEYSTANYITKLRRACIGKIALQETDEQSEQLCDRELEHTRTLFMSHYEQGHNVIISDEDIETIIPYLWGEGTSNQNIVWSGLKNHGNEVSNMIEPILRSANYWPQNIHIMVVYRRFFEWHFSRYKEHGKNLLEAIETSSESATNNGWNHPQIQKGYMSYVEIIEGSFDIERKYHSRHYHPIYFYRKLPQFLSSGKEQLTIINLHRTKDFVEDFICNVLSNTSPNLQLTASCNYVKKQRVLFNNARERNPNDIYFAQITRELHVRYAEQVSNCYTPRTIFNKISMFYEKMVTEQKESNPLFLTICLSQEKQEWFLKQSIEDEIELFSDFYYNEGGQESLLKSFQSAVEKHKYCTIDYEALFTNENWKQLFNSIIQNCSEKGYN